MAEIGFLFPDNATYEQYAKGNNFGVNFGEFLKLVPGDILRFSVKTDVKNQYRWYVRPVIKADDGTMKLGAPISSHDPPIPKG